MRNQVIRSLDEVTQRKDPGNDNTYQSVIILSCYNLSSQVIVSFT